jgi:hypothetical protein
VHLLSDVKQKAARFAQENATTLLTAGGVVGVIGTAVLTARAAFSASYALQAEQIIQMHKGLEPDEMPDPAEELPKLDKLTTLKIAGPSFIPPVITGAATIAAIIMANRMSAQKAAALAAAYGLAERNFSDYKAKVEEKLTGPKQKDVEEELAQEAVNKTPGGDKIVFVEGEVLCFDRATGRYFNSTMETIKQAVNTTNAEIFNHGFTTVNFFYEELGLAPTTWAGEVGFDGDNMLDLSYNTIMAPGNRPCIAIDFKSMPKTESTNPKYA